MTIKAKPMKKIIGRKPELLIIQKLFASNRAEFLAIYGRRRVGKTYLVETYFRNKNCVFLHVTGMKEGKLIEQIQQFTIEMGHTFYGGAELKPKTNWLEVFEQLTQIIKTIPKDKKVVLFFDEFPWMATKRSRFLQALDYYWNLHWVNDKRLKLIICGSSASWIITNIINNKGGLYNRITKSIELEPFNLKETKEFLRSRGVLYNNRQIIQLYMVIGGIPHYLNEVEKGLSATQNVDMMCFKKNGLLYNEFDKLFASLFDQSGVHEELIRIIANHRYGIGQASLIAQCKSVSRGGRAIKRLKELEEAGFIISFIPHGHTKKGIHYQIIDEYTLFYLTWIEPLLKTIKKRDRALGYWNTQAISPAWRSWSGYAFESVCYKHITNIREALQINVSAQIGYWHYLPRTKKQQGAQIDLLFDRDDDVITICEIKYTDKPFAIEKKYFKELLNKLEIYQKQTKTNKQLFLAMITSGGLKKTIYSEEIVANLVVLDDLFK
jgi:uncharacterized protein